MLRTSWLEFQFNRCWCSTATAKLHNAVLHKSAGPVIRKLILWTYTASRPLGLSSRRYAKLPSLKRSPATCTPRSLRARRAVVCCPSGVLALWHMSGALRMVSIRGCAVYLVCAPAHPWGLLASQHRPRGLPVRPPRGLPQNRARHAALRRLAGAGQRRPDQNSQIFTLLATSPRFCQLKFCNCCFALLFRNRFKSGSTHEHAHLDVLPNEVVLASLN